MTGYEASIGGGLLILAIGVVFAAVGGAMIYDHYQVTSNREKVEATVINTTVQESYDHEEALSEYTPLVTYRFTYEGTEYTSDNVFLGQEDSKYKSEAEAESIVDDYSTGETVTAYVFTKNPSRSHLLYESSILFDYLLPGGAALLGVLAVLSGFKQVREALFGD